MICAGVCGRELVRYKGESESHFKTRTGCGLSECDQEIRVKAKRKSRLKGAVWYRQEPDIMERFNLGQI